MAHPKARLYQRLRSKGFPWVLVEFHKNGSPKPHTDAFQFGVRYSLKGKRKLDPVATLDEALVILKDRNVICMHKQNGVALRKAAGKRSDSRTVIADAITPEYPDNRKGVREEMERGHAPLLPRFDGPVLKILLGGRGRTHSGHRQESRASI